MGRETNKQRRERQALSAREKAAEARAAQARIDQRRRAKAILSSVLALGVVIAVVAVIAINSGGGNNSTGRPKASDTLVSDVTGVSAADYNQVGQGSANLDAIKAISDPALTDKGKPELLFIGAEFCPFCAAERWSLINALSRFGSFSNLSQIRSAVNDGNLVTFSFYKSAYTSKYLSFVPIEDEDRNNQPLVKPTDAQMAIWKKYTGLSFPFLYYGGKYVQTQVGFSDTDLSGMTWADVTTALKDPTSKLAQDIIGEANIDTALICKMTGGQPSSVCTASGVSSITLPTASA